jgi:hypothetical protein
MLVSPSRDVQWVLNLEPTLSLDPVTHKSSQTRHAHEREIARSCDWLPEKRSDCSSNLTRNDDNSWRTLLSLSLFLSPLSCNCVLHFVCVSHALFALCCTFSLSLPLPTHIIPWRSCLLLAGRGRMSHTSEERWDPRLFLWRATTTLIACFNWLTVGCVFGFASSSSSSSSFAGMDFFCCRH